VGRTDFHDQDGDYWRRAGGVRATALASRPRCPIATDELVVVGMPETEHRIAGDDVAWSLDFDLDVVEGVIS
jgi:hypothetical protein